MKEGGSHYHPEFRQSHSEGGRDSLYAGSPNEGLPKLASVAILHNI